MRYGYSRVSSTSQSLDVQNAALNKLAVERIVSEKRSGKTLADRPELTLLLRFLQPGDELYVTRLDRLARSVADLITIVKLLEERQCSLHVIEQPIETKTAAGRMFLTILGAFAEFENEIRRERQREGILHAMASGNYGRFKRGPTFNRKEILKLKESGMPIARIAKKLGCAEWTVRRALKEIADKEGQNDVRGENQVSL